MQPRIITPAEYRRQVKPRSNPNGAAAKMMSGRRVDHKHAKKSIVAGLPYNSLEFDGLTDYLTMSNANWGSYNRDKFAIAGAIKTDSIAANLVMEKYLAANNTTDREFAVIADGNNLLRFFAYTNSQNARFYSTTTLDTTNWFAFLIYFDRNNATAADKIRMWINGSEETASSFMEPTDSIKTTTADVRIGGDLVAGKWDGLIYQPTFFSGTLPDPADVFDGTAGKLKDLSALSGVYSHVGAESDAVTDSILATDWTNNGTVTINESVPS